MGVVGGRIRITERNEEEETAFARRIFSTAELLDQLPNKIIGNIYEEYDDTGDYVDLDSFLPSWMVDTIKLAEERDCLIVTDDMLSIQCYEDLEKRNIPASSSSISLVSALYNRGEVEWKQYLKYFSLLTSYRYYLLPISVDDIERSVLEVSQNGLVLFTPKNIDLLNLPLTFSEEYGVKDRDAIRISTIFLGRILLRDDITENVSEDIFSRFLVGVLFNREAKLWGRVIINVCTKMLDDNMASSSLAYRKLALLEQQILRYSREFNPIVQNVPSLLKIGKYT